MGGLMLACILDLSVPLDAKQGISSKTMCLGIDVL